MELTTKQENGVEKLLAKLRAQPLAKEREEFGKMLFRHIDSFTTEERKRYDKLKKLLLNSENTEQQTKGANDD